MDKFLVITNYVKIVVGNIVRWLSMVPQNRNCEEYLIFFYLCCENSWNLMGK